MRARSMQTPISGAAHDRTLHELRNTDKPRASHTLRARPCAERRAGLCWNTVGVRGRLARRTGPRTQGGEMNARLPSVRRGALGPTVALLLAVALPAWAQTFMPQLQNIYPRLNNEDI